MGLRNIFGDIVTAIRGGASEVGEAIVDSQALRILEQEIRDAQDGIARAKLALRDLKAKEVGLKRELTELEADEADYLAKAKLAMEKGNQDLAREVAQRVADIRANKAEIESRYTVLEGEVKKIYQVIQQREKLIEKNKIDLQKAKTVEELNKTKKATMAAMPTSENRAKRVQRALVRVQKKHSDFENQLEADEWMQEMETGADLDKKLAAAGIGNTSSSADDILAELSANRS
jgi:phage shock protein A